MINLIPTAQKKAISYGRRNTTLVKWIIGAVIAFVGLVAITSGALFYLGQDINNYKKDIATLEDNLKEQKQEEVLADVSELNANFSLVVNVLSREVLFSKLLKHIGAIMPKGVILQDLSLSSDSSALTLNLSATDYQKAAQALVNLKAESNLLFREADANSVDCGSSNNPNYPCTASMQVLLTTENPFLLLNQGDSDE